MNSRLRDYRGQFIKKNVLKKRLFIQNLNKKKPEDKKESEKRVSGRRLVDIDVLAKYLKCSSCDKTLSLSNIINEKRYWLNSIFSIKCESCHALNKVPTSKTREALTLKNGVNEYTTVSDNNTMVVLGRSFYLYKFVFKNFLFLCKYVSIEWLK